MHLTFTFADMELVDLKSKTKIDEKSSQTLKNRCPSSNPFPRPSLAAHTLTQRFFYRFSWLRLKDNHSSSWNQSAATKDSFLPCTMR